MTIVIQNITNTVKNVNRLGGAQLAIQPNDFIKFECDSIEECVFWEKLNSRNDALNSGVIIITDTNIIRRLVKLKNNGLYDKYYGVKVVSEPIAETISNSVALNVESEVVSESISDAIESMSADYDEGDTVFEAPAESNTTETVTTAQNETTNVIEDIVNDAPLLNESTEYTEEYLNSLSKSELQAILDTKGITYKKNYSEHRLISLILEKQ